MVVVTAAWKEKSPATNRRGRRTSWLQAASLEQPSSPAGIGLYRWESWVQAKSSRVHLVPGRKVSLTHLIVTGTQAHMAGKERRKRAFDRRWLGKLESRRRGQVEMSYERDLCM